MESDVRSVAAQFIPSKASTCPFAVFLSLSLSHYYFLSSLLFFFLINILQKCDSLTLLQHTVTTLRDSFSNVLSV